MNKLTPRQALEEFKFACEYYLRATDKVYRHEALRYAQATVRMIDELPAKVVEEQRQTIFRGGRIKTPTNEEKKEKYPRKKQQESQSS